MSLSEDSIAPGRDDLQASIAVPGAHKRIYKREDSDLVQELSALSKKSPKLVKSTENDVPGCEDLGLVVTSWKMNEFKYYDVPSPFPTLARGLFTSEVKDSEVGEQDVVTVEAEDGAKARIVIRGYDKFFNIGEVPWNTWESLKVHTAAPYTLSLKSNGCIIFIAGITPTRLIVTSKHSVGQGDDTVSHAARGRMWLDRYLEGKGKVEADLAKVLFERGWTAVAELCDDDFEEHVLPYAPEITGLHLHGINLCSRHFQTLPTDAVDAFASEWGFIRTPTIVLDSIEEVHSFTDEVGRSGKWNGEAVEGFVVRTEVASSPTGRGSKERTKEGYTPYERGSSFFFKVKFDEPYMMYRDWREVTKSLLGARAKHGDGGMKMSALPKGKVKRDETRAFVEWVIEDIKRNPELYVDYGKNKGIISSRERYFKWCEGKGGITAGPSTSAEKKKDFKKTIILPIAIPGCGKTTVSLALAKLFNFGHTQSDNVQAKKASPAFVKNVMSLLNDFDVVIADKNNHLKMHRTALKDGIATSRFPRDVRLLALYWDTHSLPPAMVHRICSDRILKRGENHQTLVPDPSSKSKHEEVVWMFINTGEELADAEVDDVVEMPIADQNEVLQGLERGKEQQDELAEILGQVTRAAEGVAKILNLEMPTDDRVKDVVAEVREYQAGTSDHANAEAGTSSKNGTGGKETKKKEPKGMVDRDMGGAGGKKKGGKDGARYFALLPEFDVTTLMDSEVEKLVQKAGDSGTNGKLAKLVEMWDKLKSGKRVTKRPHVTIVHRNSIAQNAEAVRTLWDRCATVNEMLVPPVFEGTLKHIVWSEKAMVVTFEEVSALIPEDGSAGQEEQDDLAANTNNLSLDDSTGMSNKDRKTSRSLVAGLPKEVKRRLHVTVGTRDGGVAPVEGKFVLERWRDEQSGSDTLKENQEDDGENEEVYAVEFAEPVKVKGLLKGLYS
ncbi:RNA ligase-domain-containing protein [Coprinopsis sp. MPI-PUGE-AT-0042]|nr:RNA ligase-domain-containing protein [Coprinopsis sp. MPI-PUGE-AT-0042]